MSIDYHPGVSRAIYIKQLSKAELEELHNKESIRKRTYPPFYFRKEFFPDSIKMTGELTEIECKSISTQINKAKPKTKDNDGSYYLELEYQFAWDWNIFHSFPGIFEVGKLRSRGKRLIEEVK